MATWDRRKSSRYLWSTLVIVTIVVCGAFVYFSFSFETNKVLSVRRSKDYLSSPNLLTAEKCISVCDSKECVYQSKQLLDYMKADTDPCEDFHQFACGNIFEKRNPEKQYHVAQRYLDLIDLKFKNVLEKTESDPSTASGKMKIVYDSCMKHGSSDLKAVPTILKFLDSVGIQGWPNLDPEYKFVEPSLTRVIANFLSYQEFGFIEFSTRYLYLFDPYLEINSTLLKTKSTYEKIEKPVRKYLVDRILNYFSLDLEAIGGIWEESEAIHDAIKNLVEESNKLVLEYDSSENFMDCTQDFANDWTDICETLGSLIDITHANGIVSKNFVQFQGESYFMQNIFPLLRNFSDRSIANYLALNVFLNNLNALNFYFGLSRDKANLNIEPAERKGLKWLKCVNWISRNMAMALGHEYLKTDFTVPLIKDVQSLAEECVSETADLISHQEWLTEKERMKMKEKVLDIRFNLDMLIEVLTNETRMNFFYEQFHPKYENFFQNILEHKKIFKILEMQDYITNEDRLASESIFEPNARGGGSTVGIQLGLLMPPTYTPQLQRYMNLVAFGLVLSHEIGHNIQSLFRYYTNQLDYYEDKYKCLEKQYSQFMFETIGKNMNASGRYRKENFADNIAISVIDKIIRKYVSDNSSTMVPSLSNSLMQQLYINSAHMWCSVHTKESDEWNYSFSSHTADRFRILGMMQNSKGFSKAFGCIEGSYMNPLTKCSFLHNVD